MRLIVGLEYGLRDLKAKIIKILSLKKTVNLVVKIQEIKAMTKNLNKYDKKWISSEKIVSYDKNFNKQYENYVVIC